VELIENEPKEQGSLPEPEPRYHTEVLPLNREEHGQTWLRTLVSILVGLILIVLIVFLARWIYHKAHNSSVTVTTPPTSQNAPAPSSNNTSGSQPANTKPATAAPATTPPNGSASSPAPAAANSNLPNSGPGAVAAIFAGTSLAAAGLHYVINLRRLNRSNG
jgi:cytoskeletal protein RodZ